MLKSWKPKNYWASKKYAGSYKKISLFLRNVSWDPLLRKQIACHSHHTAYNLFYLHRTRRLSSLSPPDTFEDQVKWNHIWHLKEGWNDNFFIPSHCFD